jgi:hypothetical protein
MPWDRPRQTPAIASGGFQKKNIEGLFGKYSLFLNLRIVIPNTENLTKLWNSYSIHSMGLSLRN